MTTLQATQLLDGLYGNDLRKAMTTGLRHLTNVFPDLREDRKAKLIGPTLEGVGWYPTVVLRYFPDREG